jgi:hypothetical protein
MKQREIHNKEIAFLFISTLLTVIVVAFYMDWSPLRAKMQSAVDIAETSSITSSVEHQLVPKRQESVLKPQASNEVRQPRGYLTTVQELNIIKQKAAQQIEPYHSAVQEVLVWANKEWKYTLRTKERCKDADSPAWIDNDKGAAVLYAKALAYHLTGDAAYAETVKTILQRIMTEVKTIDIKDAQCRLNFGWGTPEVVASADLIENYWQNDVCNGPISTLYTKTSLGNGGCKQLFQNWLIKNPYYIVSYSAVTNQSNWGSAATNTTAYIADYVWDRPNERLIHRHPAQINHGLDLTLSPTEAYAYANRLMFNRMNGYAVEYGSSYSCDYLRNAQQSEQWPPVKSQITAQGIIPEDARRSEYCNVPKYNGKYQNYPQVHLGNNIQQCELMLRRGNRSCYDNVDDTEIPEYTYLDPDGRTKTTYLYPGRGSIERAIKAIIVDAGTEWRHESALEVAYRYYYRYHTLSGFEQWAKQLKQTSTCDQDLCFGKLTHGFAPGEQPDPPPTVPAP